MKRGCSELRPFIWLIFVYSRSMLFDSSTTNERNGSLVGTNREEKSVMVVLVVIVVLWRNSFVPSSGRECLSRSGFQGKEKEN